MGCGHQTSRGEMMSCRSRIVFLSPCPGHPPHQLHLHAQAPPGLWWLLYFQGITSGYHNVQKEKDTALMKDCLFMYFPGVPQKSYPNVPVARIGLHTQQEISRGQEDRGLHDWHRLKGVHCRKWGSGDQGLGRSLSRAERWGWTSSQVHCTIICTLATYAETAIVCLYPHLYVYVYVDLYI